MADFYADLMQALADLDIDVRIGTTPVEIPDRTPLEQDREHVAYDPDAAHAFWRTHVQVDRVFSHFWGRFLGKCSPVHFFWAPSTWPSRGSRVAESPMYSGGARPTCIRM